MPQKIGDTIIYCYTTGDYEGNELNNYGATSFNVKYKNKVYRTPNIVKCYQKIMDLLFIQNAEGYIQFDDHKLLGLFKKIFDIEDIGWRFTPNKNRVPYYISDMPGENNIEKGTLQLWAEGDPVICTRWIKGKRVTTTTYSDGKVETITK